MAQSETMDFAINKYSPPIWNLFANKQQLALSLLFECPVYCNYIFISVPFSCSEVYEQLVAGGLIVPKPEGEPPTIPMDYSWAQVGGV